MDKLMILFLRNNEKYLGLICLCFSGTGRRACGTTLEKPSWASGGKEIWFGQKCCWSDMCLVWGLNTATLYKHVVEACGCSVWLLVLVNERIRNIETNKPKVFKLRWHWSSIYIDVSYDCKWLEEVSVRPMEHNPKTSTKSKNLAVL